MPEHRCSIVRWWLTFGCYGPRPLPSLLSFAGYLHRRSAVALPRQKPQVYWVSANGGPAKHLTFDGNYNAGPSFSPDGRNIALVHGTDDGFHIGVFDMQRQRVKVLTNTRRDDSPSFAPNGAMVLYSTTDIDGPTLTAVTVVGGFSQSFALRSGIVRDPAWGPTR